MSSWRHHCNCTCRYREQVHDFEVLKLVRSCAQAVPRDLTSKHELLRCKEHAVRTCEWLNHTYGIDSTWNRTGCGTNAPADARRTCATVATQRSGLSICNKLRFHSGVEKRRLSEIKRCLGPGSAERAFFTMRYLAKQVLEVQHAS